VRNPLIDEYYAELIQRRVLSRYADSAVAMRAVKRESKR